MYITFSTLYATPLLFLSVLDVTELICYFEIFYFASSLVTKKAILLCFILATRLEQV